MTISTHWYCDTMQERVKMENYGFAFLVNFCVVFLVNFCVFVLQEILEKMPIWSILQMLIYQLNICKTINNTYHKTE